MNYLYVLRLMARHPMYLVSPYYYQPVGIDKLIAERTKYIAEAAEQEKACYEYGNCIRESNDGEYIDVLICPHENHSRSSHYAHIESTIHPWICASEHIDRLGKKIERRMRKKLGV